MTNQIISLPKLELYDSGGCGLIFIPSQLTICQTILSGYRFKSPEGIQAVAQAIVEVEMHKFYKWQSPWVQ